MAVTEASRASEHSHSPAPGVWVVDRRVMVPSAIVFLVTCALVADRKPSSVDRTITEWALNLPDALEHVVFAPMQVGSRWLGGLLVAALVVGRLFRTAIAFATAGAVAWFGTFVVGHAVRAPRPTGDELGGAVRETAAGYGFPSTHAAVAMAGVLTVAGAVKSSRWAAGRRGVGWIIPMAFGGALMPGIARLYMGAHWFNDVIGGIVLGVLAAGIGTRVARSLGRDGALEAPAGDPEQYSLRQHTS